MIELYIRCRNPQGGYAVLPDAGGLNDQCAILMDAFAVLDAAIPRLLENK